VNTTSRLEWNAALVPCHTCDFVARFCRATLTRDKVAR